MTRREFLGATAVAAAGSQAATAAAASEGGRMCCELRRYSFGAAEGDSREIAARQKRAFEKFMREAAIPALNRLGIKPVGVFYPAPQTGDNPPEDHVFVLIPHPNLESVATLSERLSGDRGFLSDGAEYLDATREEPAYRRIETSLLQAFAGMPKLETPVQNPGRVLQLRIYESPSEKTNLKKIEMFNEGGEIGIFRRVGLHPVFFGRALAGDRLPNLTYLLAFESEAELKANWDKFRADPDWLELKAKPEYADKTILSRITSLVLTPAGCSQI